MAALLAALIQPSTCTLYTVQLKVRCLYLTKWSRVPVLSQ